MAIAVRNINAAGVFAENLRKELSSYVYQPLSESSDEYSFLNRGGLWSITMPAQRIFVKIEKHFRLLTPNINLQGINLSGITRKAITDSDILSNFDLMVADASIESGSYIRKDVLYSIVKLYVRVQAFSVSNDVIQKYKLLTKQTKTKSLCNELSRRRTTTRLTNCQTAC